MSFLQLKGVEKYFGELRAIKGVNLSIEKGEFIVFVGPAGCEITGIAYTPDLTTFFVNIQHPTGNWPVAGEQPRSSTIVVRRTDAKPVGA